jgi:hypothetical protein
VDVDFNGFGKIQGEDAHDGFGVNGVTATDQVNLIIKLGDDGNKIFDVVDGGQQYVHALHSVSSFIADAARAYFNLIIPFFYQYNKENPNTST